MMPLIDARVQENRLSRRISMQLPILAEVRIDLKNVWEEIVRMRDVSAYGVGFTLSRPAKRGRLIYMTIPMPRKLRLYDLSEPQYKIWGIVRCCIRTNDPVSNAEKYLIGVAFIGARPPASFAANPSIIYDITSREENGFWSISESEPNPSESELPKEVRRQTRFRIPTEVIIEVLDDAGNSIKSEQTVTENLSFGGAAIYTTLSTKVGAFLRLKSSQHSVSIISIVRGIRTGEDNICRLHIEFIDKFFPLNGIT